MNLNEKDESQAAESGENNSKTKPPSSVDWSKYGVQRCSGCKFTTDDHGLFDAHISMCRSFNKKRIATTNQPDNEKKKYKKLLLQLEEPYLEGKTPSTTTFLLRCFHCRGYFSKVTSIKNHHSVKHASKNLMFSLVPFEDIVNPEKVTSVPVTDSHVDQQNISSSMSTPQPSSPIPITATKTACSSHGIIQPSSVKSSSMVKIMSAAKTPLNQMPIAKKDNLQACQPRKSFEEKFFREQCVPPVK
ncbi:---NA--- [Octopus vulgaris]|uniref:---NA n=1 Tax=Octopus vulgaris TaxID=6645 RepID=A0AA36F386_OCTVU|nr:---NA--- [Octopus vulgaris]